MTRLRTIAMLAAFVLGYFSPWAEHLQWTIRWMIVGTMFPVMLQLKFSRRLFTPALLKIFAANVAIGMGCFFVFRLAGNETLALAAFFTGMTPTAVAATVIMHLLGGRVDFMVGAFIVTNVGMALLYPFVIPWAVGHPGPELFWVVTKNLLIVLGVPALAAFPVRLFYKDYAKLPGKLKNVSFFIWVATIFLVVGSASGFVRSQVELSKTVIVEIALLSLVICALNFYLGQFLAPKRFRREASQALGQKNTTLTIFLALSCANPLVALGPVFYVLWHNGWNAWQLHRYGARRDRRRK